MAKKNDDFSPAELMRLLQRPETRALLNRLQQLDSSALAQAAQAATHGDTEKAKQVLSPLLQDEQVQKLTQQMRGSNGGI